jgi:hypothetical protein
MTAAAPRFELDGAVDATHCQSKTIIIDRLQVQHDWI